MFDSRFNELNCKIDAIIKFLIDNNGFNYEMYNHTCPAFSDEPDSNIVEYAQDIKKFIYDLKYPEDLPF